MVFQAMAQPPSVLFLNRVYPPVRGATGRVLRDLARSFAADGWSVTVLTTGPEKIEEKDGSIRVIRLKAPLRSKSVFGYLNVWCKLTLAGLKQPPPDLVVTMTDPPMLVTSGQMIARAKKSRHIHWCQDLYPDLLPTLGLKLPDGAMGMLRGMSRRAMRKCDRVVTIGRCMARQLTTSGIDPKRIAVIPNWPDHELLGQRNTASRTAFRSANTNTTDTSNDENEDSVYARPFEELFRDGDYPKFRVLYSGNLGRAHPVTTILDAAEILAKQNLDIEFVFVGDGPGHEKLSQERARRGLENIRFLPYQPSSRLRELMESGDVHLISMADDAAGLLVPSKLYSALAVRRPCIFVGPVQSEAARVINDFKAGAVVPQDEPEILAQTIIGLRSNSEAWFSAHEGASKAGRIFIPDEAIAAWIKRARDTVGLPSVAER